MGSDPRASCCLPCLGTIMTLQGGTEPSSPQTGLPPALSLCHRCECGCYEGVARPCWEMGSWPLVPALL